MNNMQLIANYVPGKSFFHRLHPSTKIIWVLGALLTVFFIKDPLIIFAFLVVVLVLIKASNTFATYRASLMLLLPIIFGLIFFQIVAPAFPKPWTPLARLGPFVLYNDGVYSALVLSLRIISVASFALLFIMTTYPGDLFTTMRMWGVPYEISFMVTTTIQLIPILQKEMNIILSAQRSRAMQASGFSALLPSIIPVFAGAIERVRQMSMTLESRAFGSSGKKTSIRQLKMGTLDYTLIILTIIALIGIFYLLWINQGFDRSQQMIFPAPAAIILFLGSIIGFFGILVLFARRIKN